MKDKLNRKMNKKYDSPKKKSKMLTDEKSKQLLISEMQIKKVTIDCKDQKAKEFKPLAEKLVDINPCPLLVKIQTWCSLSGEQFGTSQNKYTYHMTQKFCT